MLYGTLEQFITLTLRNGWAGRKANTGMREDEVLSGLAFAFYLNFLTRGQKMMIGFESYANKQKGLCWINLKESLKYTQIHTFKYIYVYIPIYPQPLKLKSKNKILLYRLILKIHLRGVLRWNEGNKQYCIWVFISNVSYFSNNNKKPKQMQQNTVDLCQYSHFSNKFWWIRKDFRDQRHFPCVCPARAIPGL